MIKAFQTVEDWIQQRIPALLGSPLTAVFVSYKTVGDFQPGSQETGKTGLRVIVQNGYADTSSSLPFLLSRSSESRMVGIGIMRKEARQGQLAAELHLSEAAPLIASSPNVLLVVYAGVSGFEESVDFVQAFRQSNPQSTITVLTCDCDLRGKQATLHPLHENGTIDDAIVTPYCGGEGPMGEMLHALIDSWPTAPTA